MPWSKMGSGWREGSSSQGDETEDVVDNSATLTIELCAYPIPHCDGLMI